MVYLRSGYLSVRAFTDTVPAKKAAFDHGNRPIEDILHKFESRRDKYEVVRCVREELGQKALEQEILERYDGIVLWDINTGLRNKLLKFCYREVSESI